MLNAGVEAMWRTDTGLRCKLLRRRASRLCFGFFHRLRTNCRELSGVNGHGAARGIAVRCLVAVSLGAGRHFRAVYLASAAAAPTSATAARSGVTTFVVVIRRAITRGECRDG